MTVSKFDFTHLSVPERLQLVEDLWDSLAEQDIDLTVAQERELDRRRDQLELEGPAGRPWRDVLNEFDQRGA